MKKAILICVLGVFTTLIACPVLADSISKDTMQAKPKLSDAKQGEDQSKKSSTPTVNDPEKENGDCQ